jgi:hypothetical protein
MQLKVKHVSVIDSGAFGVMLLDDIPIAVTLERSYLEGAQQVTKIPPGIYHCVKSFFNRGGYMTFEIQVPGHSRILFHSANLETQLDGCIAIGEMFGIVDNAPAILNTKKGAGFQKFWDRMGGLEAFDLIME